MHWNEKIDLLKKHFSSTEFMVPHVDRKKVLRQIENKFISRPDGYYFSNAFSGKSFVNWNGYQRSPISYEIPKTPHMAMQVLLEGNENYWVALEGKESAIMLYKANRMVAQHLHALCYWAYCTHVISLKYEFMISLEWKDERTKLVMSADKGSHTFDTLHQRAEDLEEGQLVTY